MPLLERIQKDLVGAMKTKDEARLSAIRMIKTALKKVEADLSDDQHGKVTTVLVELTAYNVMRLLHELQTAHARIAFRS